jgi:hypothetical protein
MKHRLVTFPSYHVPALLLPLFPPPVAIINSFSYKFAIESLKPQTVQIANDRLYGYRPYGVPMSLQRLDYQLYLASQNVVARMYGCASSNLSSLILVYDIKEACLKTCLSLILMSRPPTRVRVNLNLTMARHKCVGHVKIPKFGQGFKTRLAHFLPTGGEKRPAANQAFQE